MFFTYVLSWWCHWGISSSHSIIWDHIWETTSPDSGELEQVRAKSKVRGSSHLSMLMAHRLRILAVHIMTSKVSRMSQWMRLKRHSPTTFKKRRDDTTVNMFCLSPSFSIFYSLHSFITLGPVWHVVSATLMEQHEYLPGWIALHYRLIPFNRVFLIIHSSPSSPCWSHPTLPQRIHEVHLNSDIMMID